MLSVVIPSYKDPHLKKTIQSLLNNAEGEIEIIPVLDSYWPAPEDIVNDKHVKYLHIGKNGGMRRSINAGMRIAKGDYVMRLDEHCMFDEGFDVKLTLEMQDNYMMTMMRYFLDPDKWEKMDIEPIGYEKLVIQDGKKFAGQRWRNRDKLHRRLLVDETMAMQGSCWITSKKWWDDVISPLQTEGYGPHYQDSHEAVFKTWKAGGKLMLNKKTWFAHKHRSFSRTHQEGTKENPAKREQSWAYCLKVWGEYYEKEVKPKWKI